MDFHAYTTIRDACKRSSGVDVPVDENFYRVAFADAVEMGSGQFIAQLQTEQEWERAKRPYYNVWPAIVPMLTRLSLEIDSALVQLPLPALCVRLPKQHNLLTFDWKGKEVQVRCLMAGEFNEGRAISVLIDVGETMGDGEIGIPVYTYRNFPRQGNLTVEQSIAGLRHDGYAEVGVQVPESLIMDCVRLCCTLCLLENDPSVIETGCARQGPSQVRANWR